MQIMSSEGAYEDRIKFDEDEVAIVKKALHAKLFCRNEGLPVRTEKWQTLLNELADKFAIPAPKLDATLGEIPGYSYEVETNTIHVQVGEIRNFSLVSTLDGFAEALQHRTEGENVNPKFVIAFGLSMFKAAAPRMFEAAKAAGRLMYTDSEYTDGGRIAETRQAIIRQLGFMPESGRSRPACDVETENMGDAPGVERLPADIRSMLSGGDTGPAKPPKAEDADDDD